MPTRPPRPRPDHAPLPAHRGDALRADARHDDPTADEERDRRRDRRTGVVALVVASVALWAVIAAAIGLVAAL